MAVEVAGEGALEGVVGEGQCHGVAAHERRLEHARAGDLEHGGALVQPGDRPGQVAREKPGAAGDVERGGRREGRERGLERAELRLPAGTIALPKLPGAL